MNPAEKRVLRASTDVAYVDPMYPGIVRFYKDEDDALSGILAGTRAGLIVDALNALAATQRKKGRKS